MDVSGQNLEWGGIWISSGGRIHPTTCLPHTHTPHTHICHTHLVPCLCSFCRTEKEGRFGTGTFGTGTGFGFFVPLPSPSHRITCHACPCLPPCSDAPHLPQFCSLTPAPTYHPHLPTPQPPPTP